MNATHDFMIRISPESGRVTVENDVDGVITHKEISRNTLIKCFCTGIRADTPGRGTGMLPLNTLAVWQSESELRIVLWYPKLRANVALYDTPYPNFPLPRLVFGATFDEGGKLTGSRLGVVADEVPTPDTVVDAVDGVHTIVDGDVADMILGKGLFQQDAHHQTVAAQAGVVFLCQVGTKKFLRFYKPFIGGRPPMNGL